MRSVNSSSPAEPGIALWLTEKQDNYPPCSLAFPRDTALSLMGWGLGGRVTASEGRTEFNRFVLGNSQSGKEGGAGSSAAVRLCLSALGLSFPFWKMG